MASSVRYGDVARSGGGDGEAGAGDDGKRGTTRVWPAHRRAGTALIAQAEDRIRSHEQNAVRDETDAADLGAHAAAESIDAWRHRSRINDLERRARSHREYASFLTFLKPRRP
jgi:hypothetical protein